MRWVAWLLGLLLLVGAVLKLSQGQVFHPGWLRGSALPLSLGAFGEIVLSVWLISGIRLSWSLRVAAALFFCFAMATLRMIFHGVEDCGCFGALSLSPKATYWIDLAALLIAIAALRLVRFRTLLLGILLPGLICYSGTSAAAYHRHSDPKITPGNPWPSSGVVDCSADLSQGRWIVLIYSSDCARCESLASDYARDASEWAAQGKKARLALLDAEAHGSPDTFPSFPGVVRGDLLQRDLYQHTPILLLLDQGLVQVVEEGWTAVDWSYLPYSSWVR